MPLHQLLFFQLLPVMVALQRLIATVFFQRSRQFNWKPLFNFLDNAHINGPLFLFNVLGNQFVYELSNDEGKIFKIDWSEDVGLSIFIARTGDFPST